MNDLIAGACIGLVAAGAMGFVAIVVLSWREQREWWKRNG